jgi:hypothetical protein
MFTSLNKIVLVVVACSLIAVAFFSYQVGYFNGSGTVATTVQKQDAAPALPVGSPVLESRMVMGVVDGISDQKITLKNFQKLPPVGVPKSSDEDKRMTAIVIDTTVIEKIGQKDIKVIQEEQAAFTKKMQEQAGKAPEAGVLPIVPPEPFTREKITLQDIKSGDSITVFAGEDISKLDEFTASRIEIRTLPAMQAIPTAAIPATGVPPVAPTTVAPETQTPQPTAAQGSVPPPAPTTAAPTQQ